MARQKYHLTFKLIESEKDVKEFCDRHNAEASPYERKRYPAHYTPYQTSDNSFDGYIAWYHYKNCA